MMWMRPGRSTTEVSYGNRRYYTIFNVKKATNIPTQL